MDIPEAPITRLQRGFSTRDNSAFKWRRDKSVVGGFEVQSYPYFEPRGRMKEQQVLAMEAQFEECKEVWKELELRKSFIQAVESIPLETSCCGLMQNDDVTMQKLVPTLNKGWVKGINKKIKYRGYKISCFLWSWNNPIGKAKTVVMMVRFHSLTSNRI
jgi:hypothetical protein